MKHICKPQTKEEALSKARIIKTRFYKLDNNIYPCDIYYALLTKYNLW